MTLFYTGNYNDKTKFTFSPDSGESGDYAKIDRSKLVSLEIYEDARHLHTLHIEQGQRLILRMRVVKKLQKALLLENQINKEIPMADLPGTMTRLILVGYQETVKGENRQSITVIFLDDYHTEHISQWKANPLNSVILLPQEINQDG